jgi:hypothetical protein
VRVTEVEPPRKPNFRRRAGLWYVLASSYLTARLLLGRIFGGYWDLSWEFLTDLVVVTFVQLVVLELLWPSVSIQRPGDDVADAGDLEGLP